MQIPSTLTIWLAEQALPLAIIIIFLALVFVVLSLSARQRTHDLNRARSGMNEDTLAESLILYGFDPSICRLVYRYLQDEQNVDFPIQAHDLLDEDLGLDPGDVEESIREVLRLTQREYLPGLRHSPIVTVEDLVRLIQASPRVRARAA